MLHKLNNSCVLIIGQLIVLIIGQLIVQILSVLSESAGN